MHIFTIQRFCPQLIGIINNVSPRTLPTKDVTLDFIEDCTEYILSVFILS